MVRFQRRDGDSVEQGNSFGNDSINGELDNGKATGGQRREKSPRNGKSAADPGDTITEEVIGATFASIFAVE